MVMDGPRRVRDPMAWEGPRMDQKQLGTASATRLEDLVQVAEGAIVSRTLLGEEGGRVVLFSFDRGQGLSEHTTPFEALV